MQSDELAKEIIQKHGRFVKFRSPYLAEWKDITKFITPGKDFWTELKDNKAKASSDIYDGTAISAVRVLANGLQGYMARKGKFFNLELDSYNTRRSEPRPYLQSVENLFNWIFDKSNFYDFVNEAFRTGATIATVVAYIEPVNNEKLLFHACHPKEVFIASNDQYEVDTVSREVMMANRDIVNRWDLTDTKFLEDAKNAPYTERKVIHQTFPRTDRDVTKIDKKNKKFASVWVLEDEKVLLEESGFDIFPYIVWRWSTEHGGTYGRGPAHDAITDVLRSNLLSKDLLDASQYFLNPAWNIPQEKMDLFDINPGGMNPYADPSRIVTPIRSGGSYPVGKDVQAAIEAKIKDHFMTDMFLMLNNSMASKRTATEVMEMQAEKAAVMEPTTARIESEFFDQLFDLMFYHAKKLGWVEPPPEDVAQILQTSSVKINYSNLMSALRDRHYDNQMSYAEVQKLFQMSQFDQSVLDVADLKEYARELLSKSTFPHKAIRTKRQMAQIAQKRAQHQEEQIQSENLQKQAGAAKDLSQSDPKILQQMGA